MKPGLFPEDREAIANVQDALKDWHRYALTINRGDADLIIIVRKGRLAAAAQVNGGGSWNAPRSQRLSPNRNPGAPGDSIGRIPTERVIPTKLGQGPRLVLPTIRCAFLHLLPREN